MEKSSRMEKGKAKHPDLFSVPRPNLFYPSPFLLFFFPSFTRPFLLFRCLSIPPSLQPLRESNTLESHGSSDSTSLLIRSLPRQCLTCYVRETTWFLDEIQLAIDRPRQSSQECASRRAESARVIRLRSRCGDLPRISRTIESALGHSLLHLLFIYNTHDSREISMETRYLSHGRHAASSRGYSANYRSTAVDVAARASASPDDSDESTTTTWKAWT